VKINPPVLSFPRKWIEDSTRRESSLCSQGMDPRFSPRDGDCVKTNPPVLSFPRKWVEDSTRRESNLCSQAMGPRFSPRDGDDTSVGFSCSLDPFEKSRSEGLLCCLRLMGAKASLYPQMIPSKQSSAQVW
jgi:hypothetical protein